MSQFITIQVGQCGNQIGSVFWPLALEENGIKLNENNNLNSTSDDVGLQAHLQTDAFQSFFHIKEGKYPSKSRYELSNIRARAICIDMENSVIEQYHSGPYKSLFDETCLLTNSPGSGNNWAQGHYAHGTQYNEQISDMVRNAMEQCDKLHGFFLLMSLGGGTGSGLGTAILRMLDSEFPHVDRFVSCVFPANSSDVVTAPYNVALAMNEISEHATCVFPVENKALFDIRRQWNSGMKSSADSQTSFKDVNNIIVEMLLHLTTASRIPGQLNVDMNEISTNLVPFSKLQYISSSLSPQNNLQYTMTAPRCRQLVFTLVSHQNQLIKVNPLTGLVCGAAFLAKGSFNLNELRAGVDALESKVKFTPWSHKGIKVGLSDMPTSRCSYSMLGLTNTTSMKYVYKDVLKSFDTLYRRKAYIHHYTGIHQFEECKFKDCQENLVDVISKYEDIEKGLFVNVPRLNIL